MRGGLTIKSVEAGLPSVSVGKSGRLKDHLEDVLSGVEFSASGKGAGQAEILLF